MLVMVHILPKPCTPLHLTWIWGHETVDAATSASGSCTGLENIAAASVHAPREFAPAVQLQLGNSRMFSMNST